MNKKFLLLLAIPSLLLTSCKQSEFVGGDLIFSEFYVENTYSNRAVEIANIGNKELDLSKYHINIYRNAGKSNIKPTETISLTGTLSPNKTFVIAYENASDELKAKADMLSADFLGDGTFPMTICNKDNKVVDYIGYVGSFYDVANKSDTVRKVEKLKASKFDAYDWIRYPVGTLDNLGNLHCLDNNSLFNGPKLTQADFDTHYSLDGSIGGGGAVEVKLVSTIDGDTTRFNFYNGNLYAPSGVYSMRYYGINTPEIAHGGNPADPYGPEARDFTNSILNKAKHFVVQSVKDYSLTETYGRLLGYVWVSFENSPSPGDYFLLNHYILQNGYARVGHIDRGGYNDLMLYNGISYVEYLYDAQRYAISNKLHIYEEGL